MNHAASLSRIACITLQDDRSYGAEFMHRERLQALEELTAQSHFRPVNDNNGPYSVTLSQKNGYLVIDLQNGAAEDLQTLALSLRPYRRVIEDYFLMIRSFEEARSTAGPEKLESIDMGRRGIHNEGARLLMERLEGKIEMDFETARKFFTLICVLHRADVSLAG